MIELEHEMGETFCFGPGPNLRSNPKLETLVDFDDLNTNQDTQRQALVHNILICRKPPIEV